MMGKRKVITISTHEATLKKRLRSHLKSLGFRKNDEGMVPPGSSKDVIRAIHSRREILDEMGEAIANAHNPTPKGAPFYNALLTIVPQARLFFARIKAGHCVFELCG